MTIKVFDYIKDLDAFVVTKEFRRLSEHLGLAEWTPVVFICRLFALDNDYGEHLFDNWSERELRAEKCKDLGIETEDLMIVVPERFEDESDGPCHSDELRKMFWTDVFSSLEVSQEFLFAEARRLAKKSLEFYEDDLMEEDVENRIASILSGEFRFTD